MEVLEKPLTVIVVDDESSVGFLSKLKFRQAIAQGAIDFYYFDRAKDCLDFVSTKVKNREEVAVLTDINMSDLSGYELLKNIKHKYPSVAVYMMSAYDDPVSVGKSYKLGAQGYFCKPINYGEIKERLSRDFSVTIS